MIFVTIEYNHLNNKDYIKFCSNKECITMELVDRHLLIYPFPGGRIQDDCIGDLIYFLKESLMPLVKGKKSKTRKGFGENVKREMEEGKPQKQSVAIAYSEAREGKKKAKKKGMKK